MRDYKLRKRVTRLEETSGGGSGDLYRHDIKFSDSPLTRINLTLITRDSTSYDASGFIAYIQGLDGSPNIACTGIGSTTDGLCIPYFIYKGNPSTYLSVYYAKQTESGWNTAVTQSFQASNISTNFEDVVTKI